MSATVVLASPRGRPFSFPPSTQKRPAASPGGPPSSGPSDWSRRRWPAFPGEPGPPRCSWPRRPASCSPSAHPSTVVGHFTELRNGLTSMVDLRERVREIPWLAASRRRGSLGRRPWPARCEEFPVIRQSPGGLLFNPNRPRAQSTHLGLRRTARHDHHLAGQLLFLHAKRITLDGDETGSPRAPPVLPDGLLHGDLVERVHGVLYALGDHPFLRIRHQSDSFSVSAFFQEGLLTPSGRTRIFTE